MENNKYYTPTLNDFAEGLEYEWKFTSEGYTPFTHSFKFILPELQNIRIKHLDQSDIESLGWKKNEDIELKENNKLYFFIKDNDYDNSIYIEYDLESKQMLLTRGRRYSFTKFDGTIKNKSELIKLMQQLNIK